MYGKTVKPDSYIRRTYRYKTQLGTGGSGTVYLAKHMRLNKNVVIKITNDCSPEAVKIHRNEVEALKNIKSLHIPQVLDFFIEEDKSYTVMEYIDGVSFDKLLREKRSFSEPQIMCWYIQLAQTLDVIHKRNIFHRDIKPANIMLTTNGDICLIDFNSAFVIGNNTGVISRSMGYASPEQYEYFKICKSRQKEIMKHNFEYLETALLAGDCRTEPCTRASLHVNTQENIGLRNIDWGLSDIYSLGATIFHFLTKKRPPVKPGDVEKITNMEGYSRQLPEIIQKSMNSDPLKRFSSARELYDTLLNLM
ncbi:MAG: serine/threonine protein kinase [Oscillospiraceae bacterium]|nr:serine/threonine protein kinase [Oscillospiraceae bacterium]